MKTILLCIILLFGYSIVSSSQDSSAVLLPKGLKALPEFAGGTNALQKYLSYELRYPNYAREEGVQGVIIIAFVITIDGSIVNAQVVKGRELAHGLPEEALRVIRKMPAWRPALNTKNKPVPFLYFQSVVFRLQ